MAGTITYGQAAHGSSRLEDRRRKAQGIPVEIAALCDSPIAFHRALVKPAGGALEALFLSQALYWAKRASDTEGWFWKTAAEWEEETGITRHEQDSIREKLRKNGILHEDRRGMPARLYFRVDLEHLAEIVRNCNANKNAVSPQSRCDRNGKHDAGETASKYKEQETTQETTAAEDTDASELNHSDFRQAIYLYNSGTPGTVWLAQISDWVGALKSEGFIVTREHLRLAAKRGKEIAKQGKPRLALIDPFGEALAEIVKGVTPPVQTVTQTLSAAEIERNQLAAAALAKQRLDPLAMRELGFSQVEIAEMLGAAA